MKTEFSPAVLPRDLRSLTAFDHKVFRKADWFPPSVWKLYESYWLRVDGRKIGCCAFHHHVNFQDDLNAGEVPCPGSLYVASTGILPEFQGRGFGRLMKTWQIAYARHRGFKCIVTNTRKSNSAMIALNRKCGFRISRTTPGYYSDPQEPTVVMELVIR